MEDLFRREWQPLQIFENNWRDSTGAQTTTPGTPCQQCVGVGSSTSHNRAVRQDLRFAFISMHRRSRNTAKIYCVIQWIVIWARWIFGNVALYFPVLSGQLNLHRASLLSNSPQPTSFPGLMRRKGDRDVGINFFFKVFFLESKQCLLYRDIYIWHLQKRPRSTQYKCI